MNKYLILFLFILIIACKKEPNCPKTIFLNKHLSKSDIELNPYKKESISLFSENGSMYHYKFKEVIGGYYAYNYGTDDCLLQKTSGERIEWVYLSSNSNPFNIKILIYTSQTFKTGVQVVIDKTVFDIENFHDPKNLVSEIIIKNRTFKNVVKIPSKTQKDFFILYEKNEGLLYIRLNGLELFNQ